MLGVLIAGAAFAIGTMHASRSGLSRLQDAENATLTVPVVQTVGIADPRVELLEQRIRRLEAQAISSASLQPEHPQATPPPSDTEQDEVEAKEQQKWSDRYNSESGDPAWAPSTARSFSSELGQIGDRAGFQVRNVECRTSVCQADVEWPSYGDVRKSAMAIMAGQYSTNCAKRLYFPPPDEGATGTYRTTVYFDCERARTGQN